MRYGFHQLDGLNGYAAGLPHPAYYDHLWQRIEANPDENIFQAAAADLLTSFADRQRSDGGAHALPTPVVQSALRSACDLASLRGRPGPLRTDILDAALSAFVKGEAAAAAEMESFTRFLAGDRIGNVPASAGSPPLVESTRQRARQLRFDLTTSLRRSIDLDIYRSPHHREISRFLHLLTLIGVDFGRLVAGPISCTAPLLTCCSNTGPGLGRHKPKPD